jgi:hypothetical protein
MPYTRPDFDAADATFDGPAAYTLPDFDAADATFFTGTPELYVSVPSPLGAVLLLASITTGVRVAVASPLGAARALFTIPTAARISVASPLGSPAVFGFTDFTPALDDAATTRYVMDLETPDGAVRVPISSWQATLQVTNLSYVGATIPACADWIETINAATEFVIYRCTTLITGQQIEQELARAPLDTVQFDQGPTNHTASISGYGPAFEAQTDPDPLYDRTLQHVRSLSVYVSGVRARCAIDWMLRPGQRAFYGEAASMIVTYMNLYATNGGDQYMDVGERIS